MKDVLYINGLDAYTTWGITMDTQSLSALMTPPALKERVESQSRLDHGSRLVGAAPRLAARQLTLTLNLTARTEEQFFARYASFCRELATGRLTLRTAYQRGVTYRTAYVSCTQFTQFMRGMAKFSLKLTEPDPTDREDEDGEAHMGT